MNDLVKENKNLQLTTNTTKKINDETLNSKKNITDDVDEVEDESYLKLEKELQKYEKKIRDQIRIEQQLKLHAESLQTKLDDNSKLTEGIERDLEKKIEVFIL